MLLTDVFGRLFGEEETAERSPGKRLVVGRQQEWDWFRA